MTAILRGLPFFSEATSVTAPGVGARVKAHQIIVWVSVVPPESREIGAAQPRFPAILDIGNNFTFSIRASQLRQWAGIDIRSLEQISFTRHRGRQLPVYAARLWVHRNRPGDRDTLTQQSPFRLEMESGIAVYPTDFPDAPRLPLLGLRALEENRLHLRVDAERRLVSLRSPDWRTWVGRWLG